MMTTKSWTVVKDALHTTRNVYFTDRETVIKQPKKSAFIDENKKEVRAWQAVNDRTMFAPIVRHANDYSWIEMQQCGRFSANNSEVVDSYKAKLSDKPYTVSDIHSENLGLLDGEIVCLDYPTLRWTE